MRNRAVAVALTLTLAMTAMTAMTASGAAASREPSHATGPLAGFAGPGAVPWSSVGPGWLLAQWSPHLGRLATAGGDYLVLVAPDGTRYLLLHPDGFLASWSGDGRRALIESVGTPTVYRVVDLATGATLDTWRFPSSNQVFDPVAAFTRPDGFAMYVDTQSYGHQQLTRYSLGGAAEQSYPAAFAGLGRYTGEYLSSPTGTELVLGAGHGLAIVGNDGAVTATLRLTGASWCAPVSWWTSSTLLASCGSPPRLYEFPIAGGTPHALTRVPVAPDDGDLNAWRVDHATYVQVASACGYVYLARLQGAAPLMVHVPGVQSGKSVTVVGATSSALALQASVACQSGSSLLWYRPAGNHAQVLLGPPSTSGTVISAALFPTRG